MPGSGLSAKKKKKKKRERKKEEMFGEFWLAVKNEHVLASYKEKARSWVRKMMMEIFSVGLCRKR